MGASAAAVALISLMTKQFPGEKDKVLSARQFGSTAGNVIGLVVGSVAFQYLGYVLLFVCLSLIILASVFVILCF